MTPSSKPNALYAQAGGVSAVINTSMAAVIETVRAHPQTFGTLFGARNGILGVLREELINLSVLSDWELQRLKQLPGGALQACRFDLDPIEENPAQYERVFQVLKAWNIRYFFYNGGNGSMLTAQKVADYCAAQGHELHVIGVAKTIDNDLALTHCSPGYGSTAKFFATSLLEAALDLRAMYPTSTRVFLMEAMGRHTGWIALSAALVHDRLPDLPLLILFPEHPFDYAATLDRVRACLKKHGHCVIVVGEGIKTPDGQFYAVARPNREHMGWSQMGGAAVKLADALRHDLDTKIHAAVPDYLQRSAAHVVSAVDWALAYDAGKASVEAAVRGESGVLPIVVKTGEKPFRWRFESCPLEKIADLEKTVPDAFISADGFGATEAGKAYVRELIRGERPLNWKDGLPDLYPLHLAALPRRLPAWTE